jgi:hypothetical protein
MDAHKHSMGSKTYLLIDFIFLTMNLAESQERVLILKMF